MTPKFKVGDTLIYRNRSAQSDVAEVGRVVSVHPRNALSYTIKWLDWKKGMSHPSETKESRGWIEGEFIRSPERENIHEIIGYDS
jgi:hypothetical protein